MTIKDNLRKITQPARNIKDYLDLKNGLNEFEKTSHTPDSAYQAMIRLHGQTNGESTARLARHFSKAHPKPPVSSCKGLLGDLSKEETNHVVEDIQANGFHIFEKRLDDDICDQLNDYAVNNEAHYWQEGKRINSYFEPSHSQSTVYKFDESDMIKQPVFQAIMADPTFRVIAAEYINAAPILCSINQWYSSTQPPSSDDHGGQQYHFDMSRAKWLNFFVYLTDVGPEDGPHCYVKKSHLFKVNAAKPLLKRGYVRISDKDIEQAYGKDSIVELTGKKGTIMAVDTIGFHRGKPPIDNHRLIFEIIYASSLFGGNYQTHQKPKSVISEFEQALTAHPWTYQRFIK